MGDFFGCFVFVSQTKNKKENAIKVETTRERALLRARAHTRRGRKREKTIGFARTRGVLYFIKHIPDY